MVGFGGRFQVDPARHRAVGQSQTELVHVSAGQRLHDEGPLGVPVVHVLPQCQRHGIFVIRLSPDQEELELGRFRRPILEFQTLVQLLGCILVISGKARCSCRQKVHRHAAGPEGQTGLDPAPRFLSVSKLLGYFGDTPEETVMRYVEFVGSAPVRGHDYY